MHVARFPDDAPEYDAGWSAKNLEIYGLTEPREDPFAERWDPRGSEFVGPVDGSANWDCGVIGEDIKGIWCTVHPDALLADEPLVACIVGQFHSSSNRDLVPSDYHKKAHFWRVLWIAMLGAKCREDAKRAKGES